MIPDQKMILSGTSDVNGLATLLSIGKLGPQENQKHSAVMSQVTEKVLGIPKDR